MGDLSHFMKWLHGTVAGDINRRQGREGSFWKGRFQTTLVETGSHLSRCLFYKDGNTREAFWSSSLAVGSRPWLERLVGEDMEARHGIRPVKANDGESTYRLVAAQFSRRLLKKWHSTALTS